MVRQPSTRFRNDIDVAYVLTAASTASNQSKSDKDPAERLECSITA
ncbi:hypothetical protein K0817_013240 [Microbacterium sp. HD4P20]|nr:hypothetical protein [Microbacterium sp. HD4P20]MCP2637522.1 hypothetical protein [Microbacterium sp. HD4P20]